MNAPVFVADPSLDALKSSKQGQFAYENVQVAIEQLYDLRSKVIRIALMGTLLHRPDPDRDTPQSEQDEHLALLISEVATFGDVIGILETGAPCEGVHPILAKWMFGLAQQSPEDLAVVRQVKELNQRLVKAAKARSSDQSAALRAHRAAVRANFHPAITELCLSMWRDYDKDQSDRLDQAQGAAETLSNRLTRLERIGTHVRLVSLNASVEAARIGTEGQGLSLIAQEFKLLAEEVKSLAQAARKDVRAMRAID